MVKKKIKNIKYYVNIAGNVDLVFIIYLDRFYEILKWPSININHLPKDLL